MIPGQLCLPFSPPPSNNVPPLLSASEPKQDVYVITAVTMLITVFISVKNRFSVVLLTPKESWGRMGGWIDQWMLCVNVMHGCMAVCMNT